MPCELNQKNADSIMEFEAFFCGKAYDLARQVPGESNEICDARLPLCAKEHVEKRFEIGPCCNHNHM